MILTPTSSTDDAHALWVLIQHEVLGNLDLGPALAAASIVTRTGSDGWNNYKLLKHFDPAVPIAEQ